MVKSSSIMEELNLHLGAAASCVSRKLKQSSKNFIAFGTGNYIHVHTHTYELFRRIIDRIASSVTYNPRKVIIIIMLPTVFSTIFPLSSLVCSAILHVFPVSNLYVLLFTIFTGLLRERQVPSLSCTFVCLFPYTSRTVRDIEVKQGKRTNANLILDVFIVLAFERKHF